MSLVDQCLFVGLEGGDDLGMSISSVIRPTGRPAENTPIRSEAVSTRRPATQLIAVGRGDATAAEGELAAFGGEWER